MDTAEFGFQRLPDVCPGGSVQDSLVRSHDNAMRYVYNPEVTRVLITGKLRFCASASSPTNGDSETNRLNLQGLALYQHLWVLRLRKRGCKAE